MIRLGFITLAAIVTGLIIHIAIIFAVPYFASNDVWHRVLAFGPQNTVHTIDDPQAAIAISEDFDPSFVYGVCRTDVSEAPTTLRGIVPSDFWSLAYLDRWGRVQFSLTNQISGPNVNFVLATRGQQRLIDERPNLIDATSVVISATSDQSILLLRVFVGSERDRERVASAVTRLDCDPLWDEASFD